ncbi:MAG: MBL fold metallo-hydrolase, partial [Oscillospiraceae bacterium]|nr:MBL fold metallo-hydrolase [Oscillospiraceae bacterium]
MSGSDFTVTFSGVGGSCAMSGPSRRRYGSNTPCVSVRAGGRRVLLDMGTGAARLRDIEAADILLSHFHYDHIEGIPFFSPFFTGGGFYIYAPPPGGGRVRAPPSGLVTRPFLPA